MSKIKNQIIVTKSIAINTIKTNGFVVLNVRGGVVGGLFVNVKKNVVECV